MNYHDPDPDRHIPDAQYAGMTDVQIINTSRQRGFYVVAGIVDGEPLQYELSARAVSPGMQRLVDEFPGAYILLPPYQEVML